MRNCGYTREEQEPHGGRLKIIMTIIRIKELYGMLDERAVLGEYLLRKRTNECTAMLESSSSGPGIFD